MFVNDRLLYIDLHKTGCSHIRRLLERTVGGTRVGKHNRPDVMPSDRTIIGSVRNPWDWYVSLWAFGCKGAGAIHGRTTKRFTWWYYRSGLLSEMSRSRWRVGPVLKTMWADAWKPVGVWEELYADAGDPDLFRRWVTLLLSRPRRFDSGEGFAFSPLSRYAGLMTYRYVKLFSRDVSGLYSRAGPRDAAELRSFDERENALGATICTENLESDLRSALELAGYRLDANRTREIIQARSEKTNPSTHRESTYYYDDATIGLVGDRERLLVDKYGYAGPGTPPQRSR